MADREPVKWITIKGKHLPVFADGSIGVGQEEEPEPIYEDALYPDEFVEKNLPKLKDMYKQNKDLDTDEEWRKFRTKQELKDLHEIEDIDEAFDKLTEAIPQRFLSGWFRSADSDYKPHIIHNMLANPGTLNAALNVAYYNYRGQFERYSQLYKKWMSWEGAADISKKLSFKDWLNTPQEMYRGIRDQKTVASDIFSSFTPDKRVAAGFTLSDSGGGASLVKDDYSNIDKSKLITVKVKPIDTWGSFSTNGELEYLIPSYKLKKGGK